MRWTSSDRKSATARTRAGWQGIFDYVFSGFDGDAAQREFYLEERARSFHDYELMTCARDASRWESLGGGAGQGASFGFGEEGMAQLDSWFSGRSYEEAVAAHRQIMEARRIATPGHFIGSEIVGGATGVATGALSGAGQDEGDVLDRLHGAFVGGLTGGMAGALLSGAGILAARGASRPRIWGRVARRLTKSDFPDIGRTTG
ncbi:hypothetical protein [Roseobacter weihaiensis]|uniref:hypothetical protein n=1 Tax=Roseobacter weihaiensis TaxID=2763262 RepID=UPI001D0B055B|nr:hypothetical protein [Roseobacter sp. H9]